MSGDLNIMTATGNLSRDPFYMEGDRPFARISIGQTYYTKEGPKSRFIDAIANGKTAANINEHLKKGDAVILTGKIMNKKPVEIGDKKVYSLGFYIDSFKRSNKRSGGANALDNESDAPDIIDDEVPFD